jgi:hypothetical protein
MILRQGNGNGQSVKHPSDDVADKSILSIFENAPQKHAIKELDKRIRQSLPIQAFKPTPWRILLALW